MNKKIVAVLIIALLAVSFAAARVVNLQIGPSISFFKGQAPVIKLRIKPLYHSVIFIRTQSTG